MRNVLRLWFWLLLLWVPAGLAYASFDDSRTWFERLSDAERTATQADLILLGHYQYLVDGRFGQGTFDAIAAFQKSQGKSGTGVLSDPERDALRDAAGKVDSRLGIELVSDTMARVAMMIPVGLLSIRNPTDVGTSYVSADGEISLETMHASLAAQSFEELFAVMTSPDPERIVTYRNFGTSRFVVSGQIGDYSFYTMFVNTDGEAIGYSLAWGKTYEEEGPIASVYIASHFTPMGSLPPPLEVRKAQGGAGPAPAAFRLPKDNPDLIVFSADVTDDSATEFEKALAKRPNARILALNSAGGSVDAAVEMAREVHRRGMKTYVPADMGCYSACAYIFLGGSDRQVDGELGVHQISAEVADLVMAQNALGDVLDALQIFGVHQQVISHMLRTPPDDMYVFTAAELDEFGILSGDRIEIAVSLDDKAQPVGGGPVYVELSKLTDAAAAERSREYAAGRWDVLFGGIEPEVETSGEIYRVRLPTASLERASEICAAIKADGGGCYVAGS